MQWGVMLRQCSQCSTEVAQNAKFCPTCGMPLHSVEQAPEDPLLGRVLDNKFRIEQLLGIGGMGRVYKAVQLSLDKVVCVKVLRSGLMQDETVVGRFQREARAASRLNHPNSISVIDFGQAAGDGSLYLAMEYVPGRDLGKVIAEQWPLAPERIINIMDQVLSALADAHAAGIVHRDLKPENIMVADLRGTKDFVKVLDFGIATIQESSTSGSRLTQVGMVCGTPEYMSPEQARGEALDARSDVYAAGVILYQMVAGKIPFEAPTAMGIVTKHLTESPLPPSRIEGISVMDGLEAVILKALSKDPAGRQPTALALQQELNQILWKKTPYAQSRPLEDTLFDEKDIESVAYENQAQLETTMLGSAKAQERSIKRIVVPLVLGLLGLVAVAVVWFVMQRPQTKSPGEGIAGLPPAQTPADSGPGDLSPGIGKEPEPNPALPNQEIPESAKIHYHAGKELMVQNKLDRAIGELQKAISKADHFAAAHKALATAYMRMGRVDKAKKHFKLYLQAAPDSQDRKDIEDLIDSL